MDVCVQRPKDIIREVNPRTQHATSLPAHDSWLIAQKHVLMFFYITKYDTTELMVILNSFNVVQFAHARHSSSKLGSALAQSQISGSVRGEGQEKARGEMLN